ncbi:MAG: S-methyl-5-thioribose-1-phosphate isomerase [Candidatus Bathyarchaeota archaeon]|nr:S-methyl-5-thioribose-1-phosphate isomerase [Candidatus Bathyarchaeota archaeon]
MKSVKTFILKHGSLYILDQNLLPGRVEYIECRSAEDVADCIVRMRIRGAPAIGVAAAYGLALSIVRYQAGDLEGLRNELERAYKLLRSTRPTAYNLFWALDRVRRRILEACSVDEAKEIALNEAMRIEEEDIEANRRIGLYGKELIEDGDRILTHCNAGALATAGWGTALGVIRSAVADGKKVKVYATETRPKLQGARLTAFELLNEGIPVTLITDGMVGFVMARGYIDKVVVGADRIALNGDTANKIGTYTIAVLARRHGIPFYIAAPTSTIDPGIRSGDNIPIEYRSQDEVLEIGGVRIAPDGVEALNPAFDITPGELITAIITEKGIVRPPYIENIPRILDL